MSLNVNEGDRPSLLGLGRLASGELDATATAAVEGQLSDADRLVLEEIEAARSQVAPFDAAALRRRASPAPSVTEAPAVPTPANRSGRGLWLSLLALAALLLGGLVVSMQVPTTPERPDIQFRSGDALQVFVLEGKALVAWGGERLGEDTVVGFKVNATGRRGVVLLSVADDGEVDVFWPEGGRGMEPLRGQGLVPLDGTLILDDLQGSEAFVAVFDTAADTAVDQAERAFADGGLRGVRQWADATAGVDAVAVPRGQEVR